MTSLKNLFEDSGDEIEHPTQLNLPRIPKKDVPARPTGALRLVVLNESLLNTHVLPEHGELVIGRAPGVDIYVPHPSVSRRHAVLRLGPAPTIEDLSSGNGTAVNNILAAPSRPVPVSPNDSIRIGQVLAVLQRDWEAAPNTDAGGTALDFKPKGNASTPEETARQFTVNGRPIVASSDAMRRILALVARVAKTDVNVLVLGETGTGKEIVAQALHDRSPRRSNPFLALNCAALSEPLLESELFGHEKGAFTGAHEQKIGLLERTRGGTVFLDEIGDMSGAIQAKLLRVFEEKLVLRLGSLEPRPIDVRFVAATNKNLSAEAAAGRFRKDFYFRMSGVTIQIPPLRDRPAEVEPLTRLFLERFMAESGGKRVPELTAAALDALLRHAWPGNARELRNVIERAALVCDEGPIRAEHLALGLREFEATPEASVSGRNDLQGELGALERKRIVEALERCGGNQTKAADLLGMPRRTFVRKLGAYGIAREKGE